MERPGFWKDSIKDYSLQKNHLVSDPSVVATLYGLSQLPSVVSLEAREHSVA